MWLSNCARKEACLQWLTWHKGVAVNVWKGMISLAIDVSCQVCLEELSQSITHRFWNCTQAKLVWRYSEKILVNFAETVNQTLPQLERSHSIFGQRRYISNAIIAKL